MPRILLIDDDPFIRSVVRRSLARAGHEVTEAHGSVAGRALLEQRDFDVVITDLIMPDGEGIELILKLREARSPVPVIAITGGGLVPPQVYMQIARYSGATRVFAKPFELNDLHLAVDELLASRSSG